MEDYTAGPWGVMSGKGSTWRCLGGLEGKGEVEERGSACRGCAEPTA